MVTTYSLSISKVTNKEWTCALFVDDCFNFSLFWRVLGVKNGMPIPFPRSFWLLICWSTRQNKYFSISKSEKHLETRLHSIRAYLMRKTCIFTRSLRKKGFRIQSFWISHFILNLIPRVSCLHDSFDDNEGLLCGKHYREGKIPRDIKLSTDRQLLIPKENKKT